MAVRTHRYGGARWRARSRRRRFAGLALLALAACGGQSAPPSSTDPRSLAAPNAAASAQLGGVAGERPAGSSEIAGSAPVDQAIARWAARAERSPNDDGNWTQLGDAFMQKARETMDGSFYARAEQAFDRALTLTPSNAEAAVGLAWVHGGRHEFEASIEWATKALALDPQNAAAHGLIGDALVEMGDYAGARQHYRTMVELRPDLSSYSRTAHLLHISGDSRAAILLMQQAIASGGPYAENTAWCRAQLAQMYLDTGGLTAAAQVVHEALARTPHNAHVLVVAGRVRAAQADYAGAIDAYEQAAAIAPQHDVAVALGDLYRLQGREREAEQQYALVEAIHALNQQNGIRGDVQIAQFRCDHDRELPDALRIAEAAYASRPNVFVADTLAWCYHKNGRTEGAKQTIAKALRERTPNAAFLFHAGAIYAATGDRVPAQRFLAQALSLNPNFSPVGAPAAAAMLAQLGSQPPPGHSSS